MFGHFAYLLEGVKNLDTLCPYRMKITADGEVFDGEYLFGAISNSTSIAGLMKLSPDEVSFDDGKFELLLVPVPRTPAAMQALILALVNKDSYNSEGLIFRHVRHVTAETAEDLPTPARRSWRSRSRRMGSRCYYNFKKERLAYSHPRIRATFKRIV